MKRRLPLRFRVPNPPAVFVGRSEESNALAQALSRGPVAVLTGPGGLGKTALVLRHVHSQAPEQRERTLFIEVAPGTAAVSLRITLLEAFQAATQLELDWDELKSEPEAALAELIDLAEDGPWWVVLDDLHHAEAGEQLLDEVARFARNSRWLVTSRSVNPLPVLAGQIIELRGLSSAELDELSTQWGPDVDAAKRRQAIARCAGSPWLLQQLLSGAADATSHEGFVASLSDRAKSFVEALSVLTNAVDPEQVAEVAPTPSETELKELERRGILARGREGVRVHDVVRSLFANSNPSAVAMWRQRMVRVMESHDSVEAALEALRLLSALGQVDELCEALDARADELVALGLAPAVWSIIAELADERLVRWQLRLAAELGNPTALAKVSQPSADSLEDKLVWAQTLRAQGDLVAASELSRAVYEEALGAGNLSVAVLAGLLRARCLSHDGHWERAEDALAAIQPETGEQRARLDLGLCALSVARGKPPTSEVLAPLEQRAATDFSLEEASELADVLLRVGQRDAAQRVLGRLEASARGSHAAIWGARLGLINKARLELEAGHLELASAIVEETRPFARSPSILGPELMLIEGELALARGRTHQVQALSTLSPEQRRCASLTTALELAALVVRADTLAAHWRAPELDPRAAAAPNAEALRELSAWQDLARARSGESSATAADVSSMGRRGHVSQLAHAVRLGLSESHVDAVSRAKSVLREALRSGSFLFAAEARCIVIDLLMIAERFSEAAAEAEDQASAGQTMGSPRYAHEGQFAQLVASEASTEPAELVAFARSQAVAPVCARRAWSLLAGTPTLDALDDAVLGVLVASGRARPTRQLSAGQSPSAYADSWGLDPQAKRVWFDDEHIVELGDTPLLWRVLEVLAERPEGAGKEELIVRAWREASYHPLKHDSRLHVAIRKLRGLLGDSASEPSFLLTTDEGYQLGGRVLSTG